MPTDYSKNERAERLMGRRLTPEQEAAGGVLAFDAPCELGFWCPSCQIEWDESLEWSEYAAFVWCERCNFDYPSAICVQVKAAPDPKRTWVNAGPEAAARVYLDTVERAVKRALGNRAPIKKPRS